MDQIDPPADPSRSRRIAIAIRVCCLLVTTLVAVLVAFAPSADGQPEATGSSNLVESHQSEIAMELSPIDFDYPILPGTAIRGYSPPPEPWLPGHRGVDLAATAGAAVRSAGPGQVVFAGMVAGRPVISVDHAGGVRTTYEPATSDVMVGDEVTTGQVIGRVFGLHPGCSEAACLHWGARWSDDPDGYIDPLSLLGANKRPIVLKPLGAEEAR